MGEFETCIEPKRYFQVARFQLQMMKQGGDESINSFHSHVKLQALKCKYHDYNETGERVRTDSM